MNVISPVPVPEAVAEGQVVPAAAAPQNRPMGPFFWDDALLLDDQLTEDERAIRDAARAYCQDKLFPPCPAGQPPRDVRSRDHERDGGDGLPGRHA